MSSRSPILAILFCLMLVGSTIAVPSASASGIDADSGLSPDSSGSEAGTDGSESADDDIITATHLMTQSEMEALKAVVGVYDEDAADQPEGTGLRAPTEEEWAAMVGNRTVVETVTSTLGAALSSVDLSESVYFPAVGDQGSLGSCSAWAEVYYSLGYLAAEANGWDDAYLGNPEHLLSPLWTYNLQNNGYDAGSQMGTNIEVASTIGVATLATSPYYSSSGAEYDWGTEDAWREAAAYQASGYNSLGQDYTTIVSNIKALLAAGIPVICTINAYCFNTGVFPGDKDWIISSSEYSDIYTTTNHAQTIVGYDDGVTEDGETGVFKVVNSWGTEFGDDGYYYITYATLEEIIRRGGGQAGYVELAEDETADLAVWHYNTAPGRDATVTVSAVSASSGSTLGTVTPYIQAYDSSDVSSELKAMTTFMCLDISDLSEYIGDPAVRIVLTVGGNDLTSSAAVSSFRVERYLHGYAPGNASTISGQASGLPVALSRTSGGQVSLTQAASDEISAAEALGWSYDGLSFDGTQWVGVASGNGGSSSMQSGDVGDGSASSLIAFVGGSGTLTFDWKASSEDGADHLRFYVDGELIDSITGEDGWTTVEVSIESGTHQLTWSYEKDGSVSDGDDCGWVDNVEWDGLALLMYEGFEGDVSDLAVSDTDAGSGTDTWDVSGARRYSGAYSAWCAGSGDGSDGVPNDISGTYDTNMNALMEIPLTGLSSFGGYQLSFYYWSDTGTLADRMYLDGFTSSGGWERIWTQSSATSGWTPVLLELSGQTTALRFGFYSDGTSEGGEGAYLDDILLTAADDVPPASSVNALPAYSTSEVLSLACSVDDGVVEWNGHLQIYYRFGTEGSFVLYTTSSNPSGLWSGTTVDFDLSEVGGIEGTYQFYSVATDATGNAEPHPSGYDATTICDHTAPTTEAVTTGSEAPDWNEGSVSVTLTAADATTGVLRTYYRLGSGSWAEYSGTFTITADGAYTVQYYSTDVAGNVEAIRSVSINIDQTAPVITITSPANNGYVRTGTISWTVSELAGVMTTEISTDGSTWTAVSGTSITLSLDDGAYTVYIRATDVLGHASGPVSVSFVVDTGKPTVNITSPSSGSYIAASDVTVTWTASDERSGIAYCKVSIDGTAWTTIGSRSYTFRSLADGEWKVRVRAYDNAGNYRETYVTFVVDTTDPTVDIISPASGSIVTAGTIDIEWSAADGTSGIKLIEVRVDGGEWSAVFSNLYELVAMDGTHVVEVRVTDRAGHTDEANVTFSVDTVAATMDVSPTGEGAALDPVISIEFSEAMDESSVTLLFDGEYRALSWDGNVATFVPSSLEYNREYTVTVRGCDLAGIMAEMSWTFSTIRVGNISGILVDADGHPLANLTVCLSNGLNTTTDANGRFAFENVTVGTYSLTAVEDGIGTLTANVTVAGGETTDLGTRAILPAAEDDPYSGMALPAAAVIVAIALIAIGTVVWRRRTKGP